MTSQTPIVEFWGFGEQAVEFQAAWDRQKLVHQKVVSDNHPPIVALLEHQNVYTAGRSTKPSDLPTNGEKVFEIDRGGRITWHGPGQLVGYPIMQLPDPIDIVAHVRRLELLIIDVLAEFSIRGEQISGRSGVWVNSGLIPKKIAAIGTRVAKRVTMHGFALNCDNDLAPFRQIVPCGISDADVTTMSIEAGRNISVSEVVPVVQSFIASGALTRNVAKKRNLETI
jgi:lipoyl(octanoyl) transferase